MFSLSLLEQDVILIFLDLGGVGGKATADSNNPDNNNCHRNRESPYTLQDTTGSFKKYHSLSAR